MSDAIISGIVTITPGAGGWYTLTTPSNPEGERAHGREAADARAAEINAAAEPAEGSITPQGALPDSAAPLPPVDDSEAMKALKAELAASKARTAELEEAANSLVKTVVVEEEAPAGVVPGFVPREYNGKMEDKTKAALKKLGFGVTTIVLEENDSIPPTGLFISHNGKGYMIKPGEEVDVPDFIISVLDDAIMSAPIVDPTTQKVLGYRDRSKYPYRRVNAKG